MARGQLAIAGDVAGKPESGEIGADEGTEAEHGGQPGAGSFLQEGDQVRAFAVERDATAVVVQGPRHRRLDRVDPEAPQGRQGAGNRLAAVTEVVERRGNHFGLIPGPPACLVAE
jgi:hypothetical protein